MEIIAQDLHCTHIRITGADPKRISAAAEAAIEAGLSVWFSPFPCNMPSQELVPYFIECAKAAEKICQRASETVLVLGCELSLFNSGFLPGNHLLERTRAFADFQTWQPAMNKELNTALAEIVTAIRLHFTGTITYASGEWEKVDWSQFDLVSVDLYRAKHNRLRYREQLETYLAHGKPVAITEFGCCPVRGAADLGGNATFTILAFENDRLIVGAGWQYDEDEQAAYLKELFEIFKETKITAAFWFTFADYEKLYSENPEHNLDMASYGLVQILDHSGATYPGMQWEPRKAFWELANLSEFFR